MKTFLCLIINRDTKEELAEYIAEKGNKYDNEYDLIRSVRFNAIDQFEKQYKELINDLKIKGQTYY